MLIFLKFIDMLKGFRMLSNLFFMYFFFNILNYWIFKKKKIRIEFEINRFDCLSLEMVMYMMF